MERLRIDGRKSIHKMRSHGNVKIYTPQFWQRANYIPKALLKMIFLFTRSGYVSSLEGSRLNTFILHRNGRNWPGVVCLILRVVEQKSPPHVANAQPKKKKSAGPPWSGV